MIDHEAVEAALRDLISWLDYDLHKEIDREDEDQEMFESYGMLTEKFCEEYEAYRADKGSVA